MHHVPSIIIIISFRPTSTISECISFHISSFPALKMHRVHLNDPKTPAFFTESERANCAHAKQNGYDGAQRVLLNSLAMRYLRSAFAFPVPISSRPHTCLFLREDSHARLGDAAMAAPGLPFAFHVAFTPPSRQPPSRAQISGVHGFVSRRRQDRATRLYFNGHCFAHDDPCCATHRHVVR